MSELFQNKYRVASARAVWWDYRNNAAYFITICTKDKEWFLGEIIEGTMHLSATGKLAEMYWLELPRQFPYASLDDFVIMPNHIHGIAIINNEKSLDTKPEYNEPLVETRLIASLRGGITGTKNPMLSENLSRIIRWYKGRTSFESRKQNAEFSWQSRFHDHIIRNEKSYQRIKNYIVDNPRNWKEDRFYL